MERNKLNKLIKHYKKRLKEEEKIYNEKLTQLDNSSNALIKLEIPNLLLELKDSLNKIYKTSNVLLGPKNFPLFLRRIINKIGMLLLKPYLQAQEEYNSQLIHFINELIQYNQEIRKNEKEILNSLLQFNQRIIALMDLKIIEAHYKNYKDILNMQDELRKEMDILKETLRIALEELDRKIMNFMAWRMEDLTKH